MASKKSYSVTLTGLIGGLALILIEGFTGVAIDVETLVPILGMVIGAGPAMSIAKSIKAGRNNIPKEAQDLINSKVADFKANLEREAKQG